MGRSRRPTPERLAEKLLGIRQLLSLSQSQMLRRLGDTGVRVRATHISEYESGKREPPLPVVLRYAQVAYVPVEVLIDDEYNLPETLPATNIEWVMRRGRMHRRRKK